MNHWVLGESGASWRRDELTFKSVSTYMTELTPRSSIDFTATLAPNVAEVVILRK